jgi:putative tricarboxylic transport membrane protein
MLAGLYYGAMYGGSTTSVLVNMPGEASSVPTCFDGFQMTRQGRAGEALWMAAVASFIAGTISAVGLSVIGPGVARLAIKFGPPEYFGLLLFSLTALISLSGASLLRGMGAALLGIALGSVGIDDITGVARYQYGLPALSRGLELIPLTVGLFGIAEILVNAEAGVASIYEGKLGKMMPRGRELRRGIWASVRGTLLGFPLGVLPGMVPALVSFLAYDLEKRISRTPQKFGTGMIEGVAGPEASNNATATSGFLTLMIFGIPTGPALAVILAALMLYGLQPGPLLFQTSADFVWTVIGSFYIGNIMLLVLNLPLVGLWARLSLVPYKYLAPAILGISVVGAYSIRNAMLDVWFAVASGILGYVMRKFDWPIAPLLLGFILGPMLEYSFRQSMNMGGLVVLVSRPVPLVFFVLTGLMLGVFVAFMRRLPDVRGADAEA